MYESGKYMAGTCGKNWFDTLIVLTCVFSVGFDKFCGKLSDIYSIWTVFWCCLYLSTCEFVVQNVL